jgi:membrane-associated protease RseP (regulator of RpoE activity)
VIRQMGLGCLISIAAVGGCASPSLSLYEGWGRHLVNAPQRNERVEDVSLLLGSPPLHCETIEQVSPQIGVTINPKLPIIDAVQPRGPAEAAGLRAGDTILSIDDNSIGSPDDVVKAMRTHMREGEPIAFKTLRGVVLAIPSIPKAEQCYWDLQAGGVARAGGAAFVNEYGGSAGGSSSAHSRFFRASCRTHDGFIVSCQANWQE